MFNTKKGHKLHLLPLLAGLLAVVAGCASIGNPGGGLYDETPPVLRQSEPSEGATKVTKPRITLRFDENIKLNNAMEKLTVSPPQEKAPIIKSNAKTVTIELLDSLRPNTTYSIDLGDAVQDNNEGNPLESLSILFSTGDHIDSLQISGYMLNAADLEPITGAFVGIYKIREADGTPVMADSVTAESLGDSIFFSQSFMRSGKTDEYGAFRILGCSPGIYRLYGLKDGNTNYRYDLITEDIAFCDTLVSPSVPVRPVPADTLTSESDTLSQTPQATAPETPSLVLLSFNEGKLNRYLDDCARPDSVHINIRFAARNDSLPQLSFMLPDSTLIAADSILIAEPNRTCDSLSYWIRDSIYYSADTLALVMTYAFTDTTGFDIMRTDTINLYKPQTFKAADDSDNGNGKKKGKRRKKKDADAEEDSVKVIPTTFMTLRMLGGTNLDIGHKPVIEASAPLGDINLEAIRLERQQNDTLWTGMPFRWEADSIHPRRFTIIADPHFSPGESYRLDIDSAAMHNIYGHPIDKQKITFKEKRQEDYAHLLINIEGISEHAYVELLDKSDKPVQRAEVVGNQAKFVHVNAGTYYARLVIDSNNNGRFDAGNLESHIQPETVYYLNVELQLRANWSVSQTWAPKSVPLLEQKLDAVKQNKPKEKKERKSKNEEYLRKLGKL
ncbi:MAG: Ig-like domain-containing protein [Bacteroidales bacterium]|nr:Ig-like domain-containing protein [Candidatus Liminaster caballi]